jgi:dTDP-glucose 4,6-dehydratase
MNSTSNAKKILVTGGCGFIGSNFIHYILKKYKNYKIANLDKLTYAGNLENLKDIEKNPGYKFIKGDICDKKIVDEALQGVDIVVNFAAATHVDRSLYEPDSFIKTNIVGTHTLLESAKKFGIKKFIQVSTDEVYGSINEGKFKETDNLLPNSPYAASKAGADLVARAYHKTFDLPVLITRSSNNFGPFQYPEKLIPLFIANLLKSKKVPLYGSGKNIRDWIYVLDNCEAIDIVLHRGEIGEIYNIGAENEKTNIEITKTILESLGKDESFIEYVKDRPGHDFRYALDIRKIKKLGWKPKYNFKKAIKETIEWYLKNQSWVENITSGEFRNYYEKIYKNRDNCSPQSRFGDS